MLTRIQSDGRTNALTVFRDAAVQTENLAEECKGKGVVTLSEDVKTNRIVQYPVSTSTGIERPHEVGK
jgi:hypothetical protein